jgi:hypothetical protein
MYSPQNLQISIGMLIFADQSVEDGRYFIVYMAKGRLAENVLE